MDTSLKTSIAMTKLAGASLQTGPDGKQFVAVPVEDNAMFITPGGDAYLSLVHWLNRQGPDQKGNTHSVKVSYPKDHPAAKEAPLIGSSRPIFPRTSPYQGAPGQPFNQAPGYPPMTPPPGFYPPQR